MTSLDFTTATSNPLWDEPPTRSGKWAWSGCCFHVQYITPGGNLGVGKGSATLLDSQRPENGKKILF